MSSRPRDPKTDTRLHRLFPRLDGLLRVPGGEAAAQTPDLRDSGLILLAATACFAAYGVAAGCFQGGQQLFLSAFKAPLVALASVFLCLPSFYVFTTLAGGRFTVRGLAAAVSGLLGILGLFLLGLLPVAWLFSVTSRSLLFVVLLHTLAWILALGFGRRFLRTTLSGAAGGAVALWLLLLLVVSLQMATTLRPVLWRAPDQPVFAGERRFFLEQLGEVARTEPLEP